MDGGLSSAVEAVDRKVDAVLREIEALADPGVVLRAAERASRRVEAVMVRAMDLAARSDIHVADGQRTVQAWCRATVRWSAAEASDRWRVARLASVAPGLVIALDAGDVPIASVRAIARSAANRRAHRGIVGALDDLLADAAAMPVEPFCRLVRSVERYVDVDGGHRATEAAHAARTAWVGAVGDEVVTRASHGMAQGGFIREVFDHYVQAEFALDSTRTGAQCRADALHAIFLAAAAARAGSAQPPTVDIVVDQATFEAALAEMASGRRAATTQVGECRSLDGDPIDPDDAVAGALIGHVRRVVLGSDGTVINLGRRVRLFRGGARQAVWLSHGRACIYPGCEARHCDIDHLRSWNADGGDTDVGNGAPLCGHHDRWKHEQRYRIWRDPDGTWHTLRPDGTALLPAM